MNNNRMTRYAASIILVGLVLLLGVVANLRYQLVEIAIERHTQYDTVAGEGTIDGLLRFGAGFPFQFWHQDRFGSDAVNSSLNMQSIDSSGMVLRSDFRPLHFVGDVLVWLAAASICFALVRSRSARQGQYEAGQFDQPVGRRRVFDDAVVAVVIVIAPLSFVVHHKIRRHFQDQLVSRIVQNGLCRTSTMVPQIFADSVPTGLSFLPTRIRSATLFRPTKELLGKTLEQSSLLNLTLVESSDPEILSGDPGTAHLLHLSLDSLRLDSKAAAFIDAQPHLLALHANNCKFDESAKRSLIRQTHLRSVQLRGCQISGDWLPQCRWRQTAKSLILPVGMRADESLVVTDWPHLSDMQFLQSTAEHHPFASKIAIERMPNLQSVKVDVLRKYDLTIQDAPELRTIEPIQVNDFESEQVGEVSRLIQVDQLTLRNCPLLKRVGLMISESRKFDISESGGLNHLSIGAFRVGQLGMLYREPLKAGDANELIRQIGCLPRLIQLEFTGLPIADCDLSPLANHGQLQRLQFSGHKVGPEQLAQLGSMPRLVELNIGDCPVDDEAFELLNRQFPGLERLVGDLSKLSQLRLDADSRLQQIQTPPLENAETVIIKGSSLLITGLNIDSAIKRLDLHDVARLSGFSATEPLPAECSFGRFRDLRYFMVGGQNVDDVVLSKLLDCFELEQLMLAYSNISQDAWKQIGRFKGLRTLIVPGGQIDDDIVSYWSEVNELWNLTLADTQVDLGTVQWAMKNRSLRFLSLDRVNLSERAIDELPLLEQVTHLSMKKVPLSPRQLGDICKIPLDYLDISGQDLTSEHVDQLSQASSPLRLVARNCNLSGSLVKKLLTQRPRMIVDLGASTERILLAISTSDPADAGNYASRLLTGDLVHSLQDAGRNSRYLRTERTRRASRSAQLRKGSPIATPTATSMEYQSHGESAATFQTVSLPSTKRTKPGYPIGRSRRDISPIDQSDLILPPLSYFPPGEWLSGRTEQYFLPVPQR